MKHKTRNIKNIRTKKIKLSKIHLGGVFGLVIVLFLYLFFNVFSSQTISPVYFGVVNKDKKEVVQYLKTIRQQPLFISELQKYKNIYGNNIENGVFSEEKQKIDEIKNLEQILEKSPYSRDVLYRLYLLNKDLGNKQMTEEYLNRAKEIDPTITN